MENIMRKGEIACNKQFLLFLTIFSTLYGTYYTPVKDRTYYGLTHGGRRPLLCPEHISKTILATVMKFHGWIDLIKGECSAQES